jgi:hypothetical protein
MSVKPLLAALPLLFALPAAAQELTPAEAAMKAHVAFLASDAMKGREPGTPEFDLAAEYVAAQMLAAGLKPGGDKGGWFQQVPLIGWTADGQGSMTLTRSGRATAMTFGEDYVGAPSPVDPDYAVSGEVVFAGYGVTDPASGRDDYKGLDVRGRIVAVLYLGPKGLPSEVAAHLGGADAKLETAAAHGARGMILIESTQLHRVFPWPALARSWDRVRMAPLNPDGSPALSGAGVMPLGTMSFAGAAKLFAGSPIGWDEVLKADAAGGRIRTGPLGVQVAVRQKARTWKLTSANVVGVLPGGDLAAENVVLSAHLDHVGVGKPDASGDTIYNGAMDNAMGTAAMLETAKAFQASGQRPRRSLVFVAVTAEEKGLIGSRYYAQHPTVPAGSIVANVNQDMPILTYKFEDLVVYGADRTSIGPTVARAAKAQGVVLTPDPAPEQASFVRSDHYSFVRAGIPAVSIEPGPKGPGAAAILDFLEKHYHQPSDQVTLPIDWSQAVRFVGINYAIARDIADADARPTWNKGDYFGTLFKGPMAK